jgi:cytochrome c556
MQMVRLTAALAALAIGATAVYAQNAGAIKLRQDTMKSLGAAAKGPGTMAKGDAPFELAKVQASLKTIEEGATKAKDLFPDDSKSGETDALPIAFEKKADLVARLDKLAADAKAAQATITDAASFKTEWPKVVGNCGGCHKEYRKPK